MVQFSRAKLYHRPKQKGWKLKPQLKTPREKDNRKKHKKDKEIIELIAHSLGDAAFAGSFKPSKVVVHIHHDISDNSYKYSITDLEGMRFILSFCKKHHLHTLKQVYPFMVLLTKLAQ